MSAVLLVSPDPLCVKGEYQVKMPLPFVPGDAPASVCCVLCTTPMWTALCVPRSEWRLIYRLTRACLMSYASMLCLDLVCFKFIDLSVMQVIF